MHLLGIGIAHDQENNVINTVYNNIFLVHTNANPFHGIHILFDVFFHLFNVGSFFYTYQAQGICTGRHDGFRSNGFLKLHAFFTQKVFCVIRRNFLSDSSKSAVSYILAKISSRLPSKMLGSLFSFPSVLHAAKLNTTVNANSTISNFFIKTLLC
mgnify:CR=1 FL=1